MRATREELEQYAEQGFFVRTAQLSAAELEQMRAVAERADSEPPYAAAVTRIGGEPMRRSVATMLLIACFAVVPSPAQAIYGSPINGGCYIAAANDCRVHTDPIVINVAPGQSLEKLQLSLGAVVVYDWRSDVSNPPIGNFTPTIPAQDLGARCGQTYALSVQGRDSGDPPDTVYNLGVTAAFTCPSGLP